MIPIRDDNLRQHFPFVTIALIAVNVAVFVYQSLLPSTQMNEFVLHYGAVPQFIRHGRELHGIFSSMFLHGGFLHIAGNMLYLWIFGDNIESVLGPVRYLIFYLLCGLLAFASHFIFAMDSPVPMIGASGAISGVLGAYAVRFPRAKVTVLVPIFIWIWRVFEIPAIFVLGFWIVMQLISGAFGAAASGGVAWLAHVGGFIAGIMLMRAWQKRSRW